MQRAGSGIWAATAESWAWCNSLSGFAASPCGEGERERKDAGSRPRCTALLMDFSGQQAERHLIVCAKGAVPQVDQEYQSGLSIPAKLSRQEARRGGISHRRLLVELPFANRILRLDASELQALSNWLRRRGDGGIGRHAECSQRVLHDPCKYQRCHFAAKIAAHRRFIAHHGDDDARIG